MTAAIAFRTVSTASGTALAATDTTTTPDPIRSEVNRLNAVPEHENEQNAHGQRGGDGRLSWFNRASAMRIKSKQASGVASAVYHLF